MTAVSEQTAYWLEAFTGQKPASPWVQELREKAFARFVELGFPTTHDEEWRFTNGRRIGQIARGEFSKVSPTVATKLPAGARLATIEEAREHLGRYASFERHPFVALNTAFLDQASVVFIDRGVVIAEPIEFVYQSGGHARTLVVAGANSQCTIVETYLGEHAHLTNAVTEIVVDRGAVVDHYKLQNESQHVFHIATLQAQVGKSANFSSHCISFGGDLVRNEANAVLSEGSDVTLNGLYLVNGTQHVDNHTVIDHAKPHGTSHELYKGVLNGKAVAVFNGRIIVRKDAQKTDSKQTNKNLVLSDDAMINTKPELQILADDVRCTHGATIGQLDAEAAFYLQSRGIGRNEARSMLTYAFAQDIIDRIKVPALKESLEKTLFEKFHEYSQ
ncbi:MAG TPA: Fe-S cluster assembly protein SufD [Candidatus Acidoferrales bacterium]|nr:Fe-S cluster assembly protein SufD [Candidatus Acidoferrales bacterium]